MSEMHTGDRQKSLSEDRTRPRLLVLTDVNGFSGINAPLIDALAQHCTVVGAVDALRPSRSEWLCLAVRSFAPHIAHWKRRFHALLDARAKMPGIFLARSAACEAALDAWTGRFDVVLQISTLFAAGRPERRGWPRWPYVLYVDYTTRQAVREYPVWAPTEEHQPHWLRLEKAVYAGARHVFTFNKAARASVIEDYSVSPHRVSVVGSGVNRLPVTSSLPPEKSPLVIFVSNDFARHGAEIAQRTFAKVSEEVSQARLVVVGGAMAGKSITSFQRLDSEPLSQLYAEAAVLLLPGRVGGLQVTLESMAWGCVPIVCADNPHLESVVIDSETGFVAGRDDVAQLAGRTLAVLQDSRLQRRLGRQAAAHVRQHFLWSQVAEKMSQEITRWLTASLREAEFVVK